MAKYSLGSADAEIARLDAQAEFIREPTRVRWSPPGSDPACGCSTSGPAWGTWPSRRRTSSVRRAVVGLDIDPRMLAVARARAGAATARAVSSRATSRTGATRSPSTPSWVD